MQKAYFCKISIQFLTTQHTKYITQMHMEDVLPLLISFMFQDLEHVMGPCWCFWAGPHQLVNRGYMNFVIYFLLTCEFHI
jgi:hypothetical protein